jgi:microcystin-dependent protein
MSQPFVGEIRMGGWNFAPEGWAFCDGSLIAISENSTLFNLIGTTYGGDGQSTFGLPDLRGRIPIHQGTDPDGNVRVIGASGGTETVTFDLDQIPAHSHPLNAQAGPGSQPSPAGGVWAGSSLEQYSTGAPAASMAALALGPSGGSQPHDNMATYQAVTFIISLFGIYPSQN